MKQVYRKFRLSPPASWLVIILMICTGLFLVFQIHVAALIFPFVRQHRFEQFISQTKSDGKIVPKTFWQFREEYSPGYFSFDDQTIELAETQLITKLPEDGKSLLHFSAPKMQSDDYIVKINPTINVDQQMHEIVQKQLQLQSVTATVFSTPTSVVANTQDGKTLIIFADTIEHMRQANGLFDYLVSEQKLLQDTIWLNRTVLE